MTLISRLPQTTLKSCFHPRPTIWTSLNVLETKCLFTGIRYKISLLPGEPHICLDGHLIERVNSYKCVGVRVDETLSWEAHISEVVGKVAKVLAVLRRLKNYPNHNL